MEIPSGMGIGQALLMQSVGIAVQKMTMSSQVQDMEALKKLMELSVNPNVGSQIDIQV